VAFIVLAATNPSHHLFIRRASTAASGSLLPSVASRDRFLWLFLIYAAVRHLLGALLLLELALRRGGVARQQALLLCSALVFPAVATGAVAAQRLRRRSCSSGPSPTD
jgi:hypothetical protein